MIRISINHIIVDLVVEQDDSSGTPDVSDIPDEQLLVQSQPLVNICGV